MFLVQIKRDQSKKHTYSTVTEWVKQLDFFLSNRSNKRHQSLICKFTLSFKTSTLTKTSHYTPYQQKLFEEVKRLKEIEGLGYRKISYILYEKGYRSVRTNSILTNNFIYSIYKKGMIREERINRKFKTVVKDIMIYESL